MQQPVSFALSEKPIGLGARITDPRGIRPTTTRTSGGFYEDEIGVLRHCRDRSTAERVRDDRE